MNVWLSVNGRKHRVELPSAAGSGRLAGEIVASIDGRAVRADVQLIQPNVLSLLVGGAQYRCILDGDAVVVAGQRFLFELDDPRSLQGRRSTGGGAAGPRAVKAPMPGRVVRLLVAVGEEVAEGQGIIVIEAMKMQNELKAPKAGRVLRITAAVEDTVASGEVLAVID
ncbi:MAG: biotin/lipoyl-binding protein [Acidobacteriota bacterium]|nr:biotin/lipoyl-binding protein [Acidobacteriota bacterium]